MAADTPESSAYLRVAVHGLPSLYVHSGTQAAWVFAWDCHIQHTMRYVIFSKSNRAEGKGAMSEMFPQEGWAAPGSVGSWPHNSMSPVSATEPHSMRKAPCSNADPEMSVRIDLERRIRSEIYDFVSEHPCHCCAVRLLSLVHTDDGSWTKHGTELSKASGSLSALFDRLGLSKPHSSHWNWNRWHGSNKCIRSSELSWVLPRK